MKHLFLAFLLVVTAPVAGAAPRQSAAFHVENMTCAACAVTIKQALKRLVGIADIAVDGTQESVTVAFDPDHATPELIQKTITEAGFPATLVTAHE